MPLANAINPYPSRRSTVMARRGMVATSQPLAAEAGLQVLIEGGNAFDAAVTTAAVLNVVEPMSTGIGGDCFALLYLADSGAVKALNGSGRAPAGLGLDVFQTRGLDSVPLTGMLPVTVPGTVDGWAMLLEEHGTYSLSDALAPAIHYAEHGFPVTELVAGAWQRLAPKLLATPEAAAHYLIDGQRAPSPGEIFRLPALGSSLRRIAEAGREALYRGDIAQAIVEFSERNAGFLTLPDLAAHTSNWVEAISVDYRGYRVYECPPNGQGLAALLALNIAAGWDLGRLGRDSAAYLHRLIEAMRLGFADAFKFVADPEHAEIPLDDLLSDAYADQRRQLVQSDRARPEVVAGQPAGEDTVYLTVVDGTGNACSFINSLYHGFGSGMVAGDTGICLQNRGAGFVLDPNHRNCWAGGKRPYHTIIPSLITYDGALFASYGVMGGFMQPQGHLQVVSNLIDYRLTPQAALAAPRFRVATDLQAVYFERGVPLRALSDLAGMGHNIVPPAEAPMGFGGGQVIVVDGDNGVLHGGSEPRKDGCAIGY
jgi:gamma-glutamyltranspeptidase/glutathione hydrolase